MIHWLLAIASLVLTTWTAAHALLHKQNAAAAWGWIGACLLLPFAGPALYFVFGVNRVLTRARRQQPVPRIGLTRAEKAARNRPDAVPTSLGEVARSGDVITGLQLLGGNRLDILQNGEAAYPRMLAAIADARDSIALTAYIFDRDDVGERFIAALAEARARGVEVRCLLDGVGELAWRRSGTALLAREVAVARYNPLRLWPPFAHINLRNHRKLLLVDGAVAFTGGMNISARHCVAAGAHPHATADLHFELRGPVLAQLQQVFIDDWAYASGETWSPPPVADTPAPGDGDGVLCRVITDGPNEDFGHLSMVLLAAIAAAQKHIQIVTPYFVPPEELLSALMSAAVRGVVVDLILSQDRNHRITWYAMHKLIPPLLERGVCVHLQPPPFCHTKLFVVDRRYAQFGSANLDMRSMRLNFEMVVETYDRAFVEQLAQHCDALSDRATTLLLDEVRRRPVLLRLRDAACWLLSPYL